MSPLACGAATELPRATRLRQAFVGPSFRLAGVRKLDRLPWRMRCFSRYMASIKRKAARLLRAAHIEDHRAYAGAIRDRFAFGGPLQTDDGSRTVGSLIVVDFPDRKSVEEWFAPGSPQQGRGLCFHQYSSFPEQMAAKGGLRSGKMSGNFVPDGRSIAADKEEAGGEPNLTWIGSRPRDQTTGGPGDSINPARRSCWHAEALPMSELIVGSGMVVVWTRLCVTSSLIMSSSLSLCDLVVARRRRRRRRCCRRSSSCGSVVRV